MKTCPITGRVHRTARELATELARLDAQLLVLRHIEQDFHRFANILCKGAVPEAVVDAFNATTDAVEALSWERVEAAMNPRPMRESDREHYLLVKANID